MPRRRAVASGVALAVLAMAFAAVVASLSEEYEYESSNPAARVSAQMRAAR